MIYPRDLIKIYKFNTEEKFVIINKIYKLNIDNYRSNKKNKEKYVTF